MSPTQRASVTFFVPGTPKPQPRPRAFARQINGKAVARVHEANTAEGWKGAVALASKEHLPAQPIEGPVRCMILFLMPRPKRLMRKKDPEGTVWHTSKPDRDNLEKAVLDAMTAIGWWRDDAQVVCGEVAKYYHGKTGIPGAWISVEELSEATT